MTTEQQNLITAFRKEAEDLVYANILEIFLIKHGELEAIAGDNVISLPGSPYDSADDYVIGFYKAEDADGIDVKGELQVYEEEKTASGFTINAFRPCTIKWITSRKAPKINFWT